MAIPNRLECRVSGSPGPYSNFLIEGAGIAMVCVFAFFNHLFHPTAASDVFPDHSALSVKTTGPGADPTSFVSYPLAIRFAWYAHTLWNEALIRLWV